MINQEETDAAKESIEQTIEDIHAALKEIQKSEPSVGGTIMGSNFQGFSLAAIFCTLFEYEDGILYYARHGDPYGVLDWQIKKYSELRAAVKVVISNFEELYYSFRIQTNRTEPAFDDYGSVVQ